MTPEYNVEPKSKLDQDNLNQDYMLDDDTLFDQSMRQTFTLSDIEDLDMISASARQAVSLKHSPSSVARSAQHLPTEETSSSTPEHRELSQSLNQPKSDFQSAERFSIEREIGEGTFGKIWSVKDNELRRSVALKTYKGEHDTAQRACKEEVKLVGKLDHPSIPTVYDTGLMSNGQPFVMMKLLSGEGLDAIIKRLRAGDPDTHEQYTFIRRAQILMQLLRILESVHQTGVIHRDIKPENILIGSDGTAYLLDWGCAVELSETTEKSVPAGTPLFMPPEQVLGKRLTPASDLFAFAGVAYEFFSLHPAIEAEGDLHTFLKTIITHQPQPFDLIPHPSHGYPPSEFGPIVMRALHRDPEQRPQSADEMLTAFQRALEGHVEVVCPRTRLKSYAFKYLRALDKDPYRVIPRTYAVLFGAATSLVVIGGALGAWFFS